MAIQDWCLFLDLIQCEINSLQVIKGSTRYSDVLLSSDLCYIQHDYLVTMESDATKSPVDAISLMKEAFPEYVVNVFFAAGYEVITAMDISESPGNLIESIEKYISERYPNDP